MVAGQRRIPCRQRRAVLVAQLLGVQLYRQTQSPSGSKDALHVGAGKPHRVAKGVDRIDEALGVQFHCGDVALSINARPQGGYTLVLRSGEQIEADLVLSAVGLQPRVELARAAGLQTGRGIVVDTWGRTSDPDVYALGDCAAYTSAARPDIAGGAPRALPYILPIMAAAKAIAATLAGEPTPIAFGPMAVRVKTPALPLTINS